MDLTTAYDEILILSVKACPTPSYIHWLGFAQVYKDEYNYNRCTHVIVYVVNIFS